MRPNIDVTVAAVINVESKFLIVEEMVRGRRVYNQPAGHVEAGESLEQAVVREVLEETGCRFTPQSFLGVFTWRGESRSYLRIVFGGNVESAADNCSLDEGIIATHWLTKDELLKRSSMLRSPMVMQCIARHEEGIRYPLNTICEMLPNLENVANIA
jgi:8-oxo-dGTP pyrophosphatase MutT (NUDIX family)